MSFNQKWLHVRMARKITVWWIQNFSLKILDLKSFRSPKFMWDSRDSSVWTPLYLPCIYAPAPRMGPMHVSHHKIMTFWYGIHSLHDWGRVLPMTDSFSHRYYTCGFGLYDSKYKPRIRYDFRPGSPSPLWLVSSRACHIRWGLNKGLACMWG